MHEYRVVECWTDNNLCVLRCHLGRYHLARVLNVLPPAEMSLAGDEPHLGFDILVSMASGAIFRVIFESINGAEPTPSPHWTHNPASNANRAGGAAADGGH